jgi:hypothetical protein
VVGNGAGMGAAQKEAEGEVTCCEWGELQQEEHTIIHSHPIQRNCFGTKAIMFTTQRLLGKLAGKVIHVNSPWHNMLHTSGSIGRLTLSV